MGGAWGSSEPNGPPGSGSGLSEQVKEEGGPADTGSAWKTTVEMAVIHIQLFFGHFSGSTG